ncbi:MAG TPA: alpha/beta fold hydrolase [Pirellulales bacterium]
MLVDLVNVETDDSLRLDGALRFADDLSAAADESAQQLAQDGAALGVDAVLMLHGAGGNFYSSTMMASLAGRFVSLGIAALMANTRGHDGISTTTAPVGRRVQGAAYERVDACRHDVSAWLGWLESRGYRRIGLLGHSLGAVKAIYSQAHDARPRVAWLAALSPPCLAHSRSLSDRRGAEFAEDFARATELVRQGRGESLLEIRFPMPYVVSAESYVDKYGPEERYSILKHIDRVACPIVVSYGSAELPTSAAFREMPELLPAAAPQARLQITLVAGADHFYTSLHAELWARLEAALRRVLG